MHRRRADIKQTETCGVKGKKDPPVWGPFAKENVSTDLQRKLFWERGLSCIPTVLHDSEEVSHDSLSGHIGQHTKQLKQYLEQHYPTHNSPSVSVCAYM